MVCLKRLLHELTNRVAFVTTKKVQYFRIGLYFDQLIILVMMSFNVNYSPLTDRILSKDSTAQK